MHAYGRYLPSYFPERVEVKIEQEIASSDHVDVKAPDKKRRLDLSAWQVAFDRYAIGAAIVGQMTYAQVILYRVRAHGLHVHVS